MMTDGVNVGLTAFYTIQNLKLEVQLLVSFLIELSLSVGCGRVIDGGPKRFGEIKALLAVLLSPLSPLLTSSHTYHSDRPTDHRTK